MKINILQERIKFWESEKKKLKFTLETEFNDRVWEQIINWKIEELKFLLSL